MRRLVVCFNHIFLSKKSPTFWEYALAAFPRQNETVMRFYDLKSMICKGTDRLSASAWRMKRGKTMKAMKLIVLAAALLSSGATIAVPGSHDYVSRSARVYAGCDSDRNPQYWGYNDPNIVCAQGSQYFRSFYRR